LAQWTCVARGREDEHSGCREDSAVTPPAKCRLIRRQRTGSTSRTSAVVTDVTATDCQAARWPARRSAAGVRPGASRYRSWTEADLTRATRGRRPDGSQLDEFMPWKSSAE
jgi:hypothetical protein